MSDTTTIPKVLEITSPPTTLRGHDVSGINVAAIVDYDLGPILCEYDLDLTSKKAVPHRENTDPQSGLPIFTNAVALKDGLFVVLADSLYACVGSQIGTGEEKAFSQKEFVRQCERIIDAFGDSETASHTAKLVITTIKQAADRHVATVRGRNL